MDILGKQYEFRFSYKAIKEFLSLSGLSLSDFSDTTKMAMNADKMLYCGLKSGEKFHGRNMELTLEQIEGWIDEDMNNLTLAMEAFNTDIETGEEKEQTKQKKSPSN